MTCVVAVLKDGALYMASDSCSIDTESLTAFSRMDKKIFQVGTHFLVGFSGSYRVGQCLMSFKQPERVQESMLSYMVEAFVPSMIKYLQRQGAIPDVAPASMCDTSILVGTTDDLFLIENDFQVGEVMNGYMAVGIGRDVALGSLHSTKTLVEDPLTRCSMALAAATEFKAGVKGPFNILTMASES